MMRRVNLMRRLRWSTIMVGAILMVSAGCGDQDARLVNSNGQSTSESDPDVRPGTAYIAQQSHVIMPWTHQLENNVVDAAQVETDRLIFAADGPGAEQVSEFERGDVVVSANPAQPFLRKITSLEHTGDEFIFNTRNARLTEAVYKGESSEQPQTESATQGLRRQELTTQEAERFTADTVTIGGAEVSYTDPDGTKISAKPGLDFDASVYFDLKIEPADIGSQTRFEGTKTCSGSASAYRECFGAAARGAQRSVSCEAGHCVFETTEYDGWWFDGAGPDCNDIIGALDYSSNNPVCKSDFDAYYAGDISLTTLENRDNCDGHLPPHPVQTDWAKDHCTGALKRMVVDADGSMTPTTGPLTLTFAGASTGGSVDVWDSGPKKMMSKLFFIGWFPVYITANASAKLTASIQASVSATAELEPVKLTGLGYGAGIHYYASASDEDGKGVRMNDGTLKKFYQGGGYGSFHTNPERTPNPGWEGLTFSEQDLTLKASGSVTADLVLAPRLDLLLYDVAGPYIEPFSPYASVEFKAGGMFSAQDGYSGAGACGEEVTLCGRLGVKADIGLTAENICGSECDWNTSLYDTCSDYCPENAENLCVKSCLGMEPQAPSPVEVEVSWQSDAVDLDLKMLQPEPIDYQDTGDNPNGFQHGSDACPSTFNGCTDTPDGSGNYTEKIFVKPESTPPASGTTLSLQVLNFQSTGQGSFDLTISKDGEVIREWTGQSSGQEDDRHNFSFTLP